MRIVLFTTTDMQGNRAAQFERMLESVAEQRGGDFTIRHYVLLQNAEQSAVELARENLPDFCRIIAIPSRIPLSAARNLLLEQAMQSEGLDEATVVGFPDDDCWLPAPFLSNLTRAFQADPALDLFVCGLSLEPQPSHFDASLLHPAVASEVVRMGSSNNIFLRGSLAGNLGAFDTALGLGTPNHGGEDTDYAVRAFLQAQSTQYIEANLVGHQSSDLSSTAKYYRGALVVLARYASRHPGLMKEFSRKFLVGVYLVLRGKLAPGSYTAAAIAGMKVYWSTRSRLPPLTTPLPLK